MSKEFAGPGAHEFLERAQRFLCAVVVLVSLALPPAARAALTIEIIGTGANQFPVAIVPFRAEDGLAQRITPVVAADLARSGLFRMVDAGGITPPPHEPEQVDYSQWRARGAEAVVIGAVMQLADGRYDVRFRLMDAVKQTQLAGYVYFARSDNLRLVAHKIADMIYEKLTGDVGVFSTRITYIVKRGSRYELQVADADGFNAQTILASNEPIISPAWSPDGTRLAVTLTKDGGSQLYLINADGSGVVRLTQSSAIDTEPNFSPDGRHLIFTSDRGGTPQIYRVSVTGGQPDRLTFEGSYNVSPRHSPDGKSFTFIQRNGTRFNVAVQDFATRQVQVLTDGAVDESPSFAPNGKLILYATEVRGRGILSAVSSDGRVKQRLTADVGDAREPAWGPLPKQ